MLCALRTALESYSGDSADIKLACAVESQDVVAFPPRMLQMRQRRALRRSVLEYGASLLQLQAAWSRKQ